MIRYGFIKDCTCYIDGSKGDVVKQQFANGITRTVCISCYKSLNIIEVKEPKEKIGRKYWGQTPIEKEFTEYFNQNIDRWHHELIAHLKGPTKCCFLRRETNDLR